MRTFRLAAFAVFGLLGLGLLGSATAMADDLTGQQDQAAAVAAMERQAASSGFADPTVGDSLRSHGHP